MEEFAIREGSLSKSSAKNLIKFYYGKMNDLKEIPIQLYKENGLIDSEDGLDLLC